MTGTRDTERGRPAPFGLAPDEPAGAMARMVADTRYDALPEDVIEIAKWAILDTLAVTIAGSSWEASPAVVAQAASWGGAPEARVLVYGHRVSAPMAAFGNGVMARAIDMGDVHETGGHITEWNLPAMLSVCGIAGRRVSGKDLITAYVTGGEVGVRASAAVNLARYHTTWGMPGEWNGPLCAAASVAKILGLSMDETWNAMGMSYAVHSLSEYNKYYEGTQMPRVQHSFAGDTAVKAALLSRAGISAPRGIFTGRPSGILRHIAWDDVQPELLTERLGEHWQLAEGLSLKPYSACKFTHSFIASTATIMRDNDLDADEVATIECVGSESARMTFEPAEAKWNPRTAPEAMFSAPYTIASAALTGGFFLDDLSAASLDDPRRRDLMRRVVMRADPEHDDPFEGFSVTVTMNDGRVFSHRTPYVRGHTLNPMTWDDLEEKLRRCAAHSGAPFSESRIARIAEICIGLEEIDDVTQLVDAMIADGR